MQKLPLVRVKSRDSQLEKRLNAQNLLLLQSVPLETKHNGTGETANSAVNDTVHVKDFALDNDQTVNLLHEVDGIYYGTTAADFRLS